MSSEKKNFELDRRSLLKNILVGTGIGTSGVFHTFLTNMMIDFMQKGTAHAAGVDPAFEDFKFINFALNGGVPGYYWNLPLRPHGNDTFVPGAMMTTKFNPDGSSVYATTQVGNYHMPHLWNSRIPTTGGSAPMKDIAKHMLVMRGLDLQLDSHDILLYRQIAPIDGGPSLTGLVADVASTPLPAVSRVSYGAEKFYRSESGVTCLELAGSNNPLAKAMSPFTTTSSTLFLNNGAVESAIDQALLRMQASSMNKSKYLPSTFATRFNAKKMMMKQFGNLQLEFTTLVAKYTSLINRSFGPSNEIKLAGVEDISFPGNGGLKHSFDDIYIFTGSDILSITNGNTTIHELAEGMAITEYMIINGLSSSVNTRAGNILNCFVQEAINKETKKVALINKNYELGADVHQTGADIQLVIFTRYFRAVSACLNELMARLKETKTSGGNLFDKTVIGVNTEFNRYPRKDGSGSDHGYNGSSYTLFSGMVDELKVAGNITTNTYGTGTWGFGASLQEIGGRVAGIGNATSTVSNLLEIKSPTPNDASFTTKENGKAKMIITSLKNVA